MTTKNPVCFVCDAINVGWVGNIPVCIDCFHLPHSSFMLKQEKTIRELKDKLQQVNDAETCANGTG